MIANIIKKWIIVPVMGAIWLLSLLYGSGIGMQLDVYGKAKYLVIILFIFSVLLNRNNIESKKYKLFSVLTIFIIAFHCIFTKIVYGNNIVDYIWIYLLIPLIGMIKIEETQMKIVSLLYGMLGLAVLFIYNYGSAFAGWNTNSIAIIAFFSATVMIVSFNNNKNFASVCFLLLYFYLYYKWIEVLNSRGGMLFAFIALLGILKIIPFNKLFKMDNSLIFILLIPLIVAIVIVLIRNTSFASSLNSWSISEFNKPIFNGRDNLFYKGFIQWLKHPILGVGNLSYSNWHNSAITMLVGCGLIGFWIWIFNIQKFLKKCILYLDDGIVYGLMLGFLTIWIQQSTELGLVASQVNAIPYAMLGLILGRINTINKSERKN